MHKIQIQDCTLYLGDCMEIMPRIGHVDAVVTDPPYGINENSSRAKSRSKLARTTDYGVFDWDKEPATPHQINTIRHISDYQIIFGGNYFHLPPSRCWLVWDKENGSNNFADCELAWTNLNKSVRMMRWMWNGMIRKGQMSRNVDHTRVHPTQKPVEVMEWCIGHLPDTAQTILDPFMGSGSTGVACAKMGRKFIGVEMDPIYFEKSIRRIKEAYQQPDMFNRR